MFTREKRTFRQVHDSKIARLFCTDQDSGGKGNFGLMNYIYKVVDVNPQISKPRNFYNAEIKNLYAVVTISLQIVDNKWFTMLR